MKAIILIAVILCVGSATNAQVSVFNKVYDNDSLWEFGYAVAETSNGFLIGGSTQDFFNNYFAAYLVKVNTGGDTLWNKKYDLTSGNDVILDIITINSGGYMLCGFLKDTVTSLDVAYLMRIDEQGDILWMQQYGSINNNWAWNLTQTLDGGFAIAGWTWNTSPYLQDAWVLKTDSLGNVLWQKQFDNYSNVDRFEKVIITPDSGIVCAGVTFLNSNGKDYVVKFNQQGDTIWTKQFGGVECGGTFDINLTADNGFIGCGAICINGEQKASVYRLDSLGNQLWYKTFARGSGFGEVYSFESVHELPNGNFMAAGVDFDYTQAVPGSAPRVRLLELNALGDSIWSKQYTHYGDSTQDYLLDMKLTSDGGYIMCGYTIDLYDKYGQENDVLVIKVDSIDCMNYVNGCQTVGVVPSPLERVGVRIYPNPTIGVITLDYDQQNNNNLRIEVYNVLGEKVYAALLTTSTINLNALHNGMYLIKVLNHSGIPVSAHRLIIQK